MRHLSRLSKLKICLFCCFAFFSSPVWAIEKEVPSIKNIVKKANSEKIIQSGLLVIAREGKILFTQSYGYADRDQKSTITIDTLFPLGSISKQFTAALILKLVEMKKIDLNAPIDTYLSNVPKEWHQIKVHDLLTHTNGLRECYDLLNYSARYDRDACLEAVKSLPLTHVPGKTFEYNNTGYFLLAKIIEKVTGKSYPDVIKQMLNRPLNLTHIYSPNVEGDYPNAVFQKDRLAKHYLITPQAGKIEYAKAKEANLNFAHYLTGAGELVGSANDLIAWTQDLFESDYLTKNSLDKMKTKYVYDAQKRRWYGYGLCIRESEVGDVYFHAGKIDRNGTLFIAYVPRSKLQLIILSNVYEKDYNPLPIFDYGVGLIVALSKVL